MTPKKMVSEYLQKQTVVWICSDDDMQTLIASKVSVLVKAIKKVDIV